MKEIPCERCQNEKQRALLLMQKAFETGTTQRATWKQPRGSHLCTALDSIKVLLIPGPKWGALKKIWCWARPLALPHPPPSKQKRHTLPNCVCLFYVQSRNRFRLGSKKGVRSCFWVACAKIILTLSPPLAANGFAAPWLALQMAPTPTRRLSFALVSPQVPIGSSRPLASASDTQKRPEALE